MKLFIPAFRIGTFVMLLWACVMLLPLLVSIPLWLECLPFIYSSIVCLLLSGLLFRASKGSVRHLHPRALFMATSFNWLLLSLTGTLPYYFSDLQLGFTDCLFESISGITTTGASIFPDVEHLPLGILLWRSVSQWVGGIGIILVAVAVMPSIKSGAMKLFRSEFSEWSQLESGRISSIAVGIMLMYLMISVLCFVAFILFGMNWFDALNHAMTTVSTGGFSTWNASFGHFNNNHLQFVSSFFMILGACPFLMIVMSIRNRSFLLLKDRQVQHLILMTLFSALLIFIWRYYKYPGTDTLQVLESSFFNIVSIATTTGFASENYAVWGSFPVMVICFLMFSGGASGSTSGGIKLFRYHLLFIFTREHLQSALHPGITLSRQYNNRPVGDDILVASLAFFFFVIVSLCVSSTLLAASGLDPITSITGALSALMNVGPGLGDIIGPDGNYSSLPAFSKYILGADMLLGRLEYLAPVIIVTREYWQW